MPSTDSDGVPPATWSVIERYERIVWIVAALIAVTLAVLVTAALIALPLLPGLTAALLVLIALRVPVFGTDGHFELATAAAPDAVLADFEGRRPPVLAFLWGRADRVRETDDGVVFEFSYLAGLRSVTMSLESERRADDTLAVTVRENERPWGRYLVTIRENGGETIVDVDVGSERRFGLRRLPGALVMRRYRDTVFRTQGYEVRDGGVRVTVLGRNNP